MAEPVIVFQKAVGETHLVIVDTENGDRGIYLLSADGNTTLLALDSTGATALAESLTDFVGIAAQVPFSHFEPEQAEVGQVEYIETDDVLGTEPPAPGFFDDVPSITNVPFPDEDGWTDIPGEFTISEPSA